MITFCTTFGEAKLLKVLLHDVRLSRQCNLILEDLVAQPPYPGTPPQDRGPDADHEE